MERSYTCAGITVVVAADANWCEAVDFCDAKTGVRYHHFVVGFKCHYNSFQLCNNTVMFCLYPRGHEVLIEVAVTPRYARKGEQGWLLLTRKFLATGEKAGCILKGFEELQSVGSQISIPS